MLMSNYNITCEHNWKLFVIKNYFQKIVLTSLRSVSSLGIECDETLENKSVIAQGFSEIML